MLKVAIVGCGKIADGHVEEIQKQSNAHIVGVCDQEPLMAEQIAVRYGLGAYFANFDRLLDEARPDVVHITTPPQSHLPLAVKAMDAGCHVYVEKPLALNAADSRILLDHATRTGKKMTVGYSAYYDPPARMMRALAAQGVLGEPVHVESFLGYSLAGVFGKAVLADRGHWVHQLPGKLFQNNLDHILYKIAEFVTDEHPLVKTFGYRRRSATGDEVVDSMPDELRVIIGGAKVSGYGTFSSHAKPVGHFLRVYGTRNTIHVNYVTRTVTLDPDPKLPSAIGRILPAFGQAWEYFREGSRNVLRFARSEYSFFAGMNYLISAFYASIQKDEPLPIPYGEMLRVAETMDQIFAQMAETPIGDAS